MRIRCNRNIERGFSLIEMVVAIVVFGVILAMGIPLVSGFTESNRVVGATNTLVADVHSARSLAHMQRRTYQIAFNGNSYVMYRVAPAETVRTRALPKGVTCAASDTATFFAWGLCDPVSVLVAGKNDSTTVQVAANGGVSHD